MLKKYFPYIVLIAAALLFFWVKKNQKGPDHRMEKTTIPVHASEPFARDTMHIVYSKHAQCRMACRFIEQGEVKEIIMKGSLNYDKIEENEKGKTYPLEGITHDGQHVRLVVAPHDNSLTIVTVIDLGKEWPCNCN